MPVINHVNVINAKENSELHLIAINTLNNVSNDFETSPKIDLHNHLPQSVIETD